MKTLPVLLLLIFACGCSPQKTLANRLKGSDRVVVTNSVAGYSISITGGEVAQIVQAIAAGEKESPNIMASPYLVFQFYKGKEHLGDVVTAYEIFVIDLKPYRDTTGIIKKFSERYRKDKERPPRLSP